MAKNNIPGTVVSNKKSGESSKTTTTLHRIISSCCGAFLTSISMTPFDVVKNRMQAGLLSSSGSTFKSMALIARQEGLSSLWRGLSPTLLISIPQTAVYFVAYESIKTSQKLNPWSSSIYSPAIAGVLARCLAVSLTNPIELIRTRVQAGRIGLGKVILEVVALSRIHGLANTFGKGLGHTLLRDAPFSAIYWSIIENFKSRVNIIWPNRSYSHELGISFLAGSLAGTIAATLTHPFDVLKTIAQVSPDFSRPIWLHIYRSQGISGFFVGFLPRIAKAAPACGIMISTYEVGKRLLTEVIPGKVAIKHPKIL